MSEAQLPKICIGLPIFNEAKYLEQTLQSLLGQTYPNIEIIVSDNASTDESAQICKQYATKDPRLSFYSYAENRGVTVNSTRVLELASGDYFMWASGHDLWSEDLIEKCVGALEVHPDATIAYAASQWVDGNGRQMELESGVYDTRGMGSIGRFFTVFWGNMHPVLGVIRMSSIKSIPKIHGCVGADLLVLAELALQGDFIFVPDALWTRRETRGVESYAEKIARYKSKSFSLVSSGIDKIFPLARLPWELVKTVLRSKISLAEKASILLLLLPSFIARYVEGGR